jgi:hypothetical protein
MTTEVLLHMLGDKFLLLRFSSWIITSCALMSRKVNHQLFWLTLNLYAGGLKARPQRRLRALSAPVMSTSTFYRHLKKATEQYADKLQLQIQSPLIRIDWIDNFARHFALNGIHLGTFSSSSPIVG